MEPQVHTKPQTPDGTDLIDIPKSPSALHLEVRFYRDDTLIEVGHFEKPSQLTVGSHPLDTFAIFDSHLPDENFPLIVPHKGGFGVFFTSSMELSLEPQNGVAHDLQPAQHDLQSKTWRGIEGHIYPIKKSETIWLQTPTLSISCALVAPQEKMEIAPVQRDYLLWRVLSFSAAAHIALILMFQIVPKGAMALGEVTLKNRFDSRIVIPPPPPVVKKPKLELAKKVEEPKFEKAKETTQKVTTPVETTHHKPLTAQERVRKVGIFGALAGLGGSGGDLFGRNNADNLLGKVLGSAGGPGAFGFGGRGFGAGDGDGNGTGCAYCGAPGSWSSSRGRYARGKITAGVRTRSKRIRERFVQNTILKGGLTKEQVARVIRMHWAQIRYCYEKELTQKPNLSGKIAMKWQINGTGGVESADIKESTMNNESVENCIKRRILRWRFPTPQGGGVVSVTYPFIFKVAGR
ncbi:MAG: AgmX/PglI C-terminal domain-containing protein [Myxococcales bacterium]|nr:AgmX/PglI C-terminal domain-containing protein [Myxococcales bacterium]